MALAAAAFPAAAASLDLHQIHLGIIDALLDGLSHLNILALSEADIPVPVSYDDRGPEFDPSS